MQSFHQVRDAQDRDAGTHNKEARSQGRLTITIHIGRCINYFAEQSFDNIGIESTQLKNFNVRRNNAGLFGLYVRRCGLQP